MKFLMTVLKLSLGVPLLLILGAAIGTIFAGLLMLLAIVVFVLCMAGLPLALVMGVTAEDAVTRIRKEME